MKLNAFKIHNIDNVADTKKKITDPDTTCQVISNPDPTFRVILDLDPFRRPIFSDPHADPDSWSILEHLQKIL